MTPVKNNKNENIVNEFIKLIDQIKYDIDKSLNKKDKLKHTFRLKQINNAIDILKKYPKEIKSGEQLKDIKGIGKGTISRINEILEKGKLSEIRVDKKYKKYMDYIEELEQVIGIGRKTAYNFVTKYNIKSVNDLIKKYEQGKIKLNDQILLGLKYYGVYKQNIPRSEVKKIDKYLQNISKKINNDIRLKICGSYRRKKPFSNDIDVLLTHPDIKTKLELKNKKNYLRILVDKLKDDNFLIDAMTYEDFETKYMGFCQLTTNKNKYPIRRIDIRYVAFESYYTALLYFTGSGNFNRKMRGLAIELGYKLNEYGLFRKDGTRIEVNSEKEIFEKLGMEYIPPSKRL